MISEPLYLDQNYYHIVVKGCIWMEGSIMRFRLEGEIRVTYSVGRDDDLLYKTFTQMLATEVERGMHHVDGDFYLTVGANVYTNIGGRHRKPVTKVNNYMYFHNYASRVPLP